MATRARTRSSYLLLDVVSALGRRASEEHGGRSWAALLPTDSAMRIELWMEEAILGVSVLQRSRQCGWNSSCLSSSMACLSSASRAAVVMDQLQFPAPFVVEYRSKCFPSDLYIAREEGDDWQWRNAWEFNCSTARDLSDETCRWDAKVEDDLARAKLLGSGQKFGQFPNIGNLQGLHCKMSL